MRLASLFSGGKDSCYSLFLAMEEHEIVCLITLISENKESYMFHTPNIHIADLQAEAAGIPLLKRATKGVKEEELADLEEAIREAKKKYMIEGVVTGALASQYQASRIQKICDSLGLDCINPLWQKDQLDVLNEIVSSGFEVIISGIFAYPLNEKWLGRRIDKDMIKELAVLQEKYKMNPAGEGGEIETTVLDAPFFNKRIRIVESEKTAKENEGLFVIKRAELVGK